MNTLNGNFIEKYIPNIKNATIDINIGGVNATMSVSDFATAVAAPTYKVYTALLTQNGNGSYLENLPLTIGTTYYIDNSVGESGWDFTNVGAQNNNVGTVFIATGTTPNNWTNGNLISGVPFANVLENTLGDIRFFYLEPGRYSIISSNLFKIASMVLIITPFAKDTGGGYSSDIRFRNVPASNTSSAIPIETAGETGLTDNALFNTPIEIRVYN